MEVEHVSGKNVGHTMLYALSTCPWCQKTKRLLKELGVEYDYIDVDYLDGAEKTKVMDDEEVEPGLFIPDSGTGQQEMHCRVQRG